MAEASAEEKEEESKESSVAKKCEECGLVLPSSEEARREHPRQWHADRIFRGLYLSGESSAKSETELTRKKITHIVNCSKDLPCYFEKSSHLKIQYLHLPLDDDDRQELSSESVLDRAAYWMIDAISKQNGTVLVHCQRGVSRSPAIVLAYIMRAKTSLDFEDCISHVKRKGPMVKPNDHFLDQLRKYYHRCQLEKFGR